MSLARRLILERLHAFRLATQTEALVSLAPTEVDHNARAQVLRNGLAVVGFAILEDFIKSRAGEVVQRIGHGAAAFTDLPEGIQRAATSGVVSALRFQEQLLDSSSVIGFHQSHALKIASTLNARYDLSPLAFGHDKHNLSAGDVEAILTAFHIDNPWNAMGGVAQRCGVGIVALKEAFSRAAQRRHTAAHRADAGVEITDLQSLAQEILAISISFDLLLSHALRKLLDADRNYLTGRVKIAARHVTIRFLVPSDNGYWRETLVGASRAVARRKQLNTLRAEATQRARKVGDALVVLDQKGLPVEWATPAVD